MLPLPLPSKDSYFQAFGPKDPVIQGFWAIFDAKGYRALERNPVAPFERNPVADVHGCRRCSMASSASFLGAGPCPWKAGRTLSLGFRFRVSGFGGFGVGLG